MTAILTAVLVTVVTAVVGIIGKAVTDWSKREKARDEVQKADNDRYAANEGRYAAIEALEMGIATIGETVVKGLREAGSDGKIHKDEIKGIQKAALSEAVKIATSPDAIEFLTTTAFETIAAIISGIVQGKKTVKE